MAKTAGAVRKEYTPLSMDDLATSVMAEPNEAKQLAPKGRGNAPAERSDIMKQFDAWAQEMYDAWSRNGKPEPFTDAYPPRKMFVAKAQADTVHFLARKSAQFTQHGIRFGTDTPTTNGRVCVSWCITDKIPRKSKSASNGTGDTEA